MPYYQKHSTVMMTVTITETQLQVTNGFYAVSATFPWANSVGINLPKSRTSSGTLKSYEIKMVFPSLLLIYFW